MNVASRISPSPPFSDVSSVRDVTLRLTGGVPPVSVYSTPSVNDAAVRPSFGVPLATSAFDVTFFAGCSFEPGRSSTT